VTESIVSASTNIELQWGVKIPLRDGVRLNATVYLPGHPAAPAPCIVTMTPYVSDGCHERAAYFASAGLPFVVVDVRGRGNSEGAFRPMIQDAQDGYDIVEWLAAQPYCNGKVGMYGASYLGYVQWATAKERPPHLSTIIPTAAVFPGLDFPMRSNVFLSYAIRWLTYVGGRTRQALIMADDTYWAKVYRRWYDSGRPLRELDVIAGNPSPQFQEWLDHPERDAYWDEYTPTPRQYESLDLPILTITGICDDDQPGALEYYRRHLQHAPRERHYLVIGPWDHAGTATPAAEFGGLKSGPASVIDMPKLLREWYAWTLQAGPKPEFLAKRVAYYVMGAEQWRYADSLEAITEGHECLFLDSSGSADDVFHSGSLGTVRGAGAPDSYVHDPRGPLDFPVEQDVAVMRATFANPADALAMRHRQLVYHSTAFERDTEVSGFFKLTAWLAIDCPDTDFHVTVYEIGLDGSSLRLCMDVLRARYREGVRTPRLIQTDEPLRYDFEHFNFVAREVKRGHRLRLVIAPLGRVAESIFSARNYHGGGVVADESASQARTVTVRLFHDEAHPSALYMPIGRAESS